MRNIIFWMRGFSLCLGWLATVSIANAQYILEGIVADSTHLPLPFATVRPNAEAGIGSVTDLEGRFRLELRQNPTSLTFTYVGYKVLTVSPVPAERPLRITLHTAAYDLPEAIIVAGENPAHRLIRSAIDQRHRNNPERSRPYQCHTYNKVVFDLLPNAEGLAKVSKTKNDTTQKTYAEARKQYNQMKMLAARQHLFLTESATERTFLLPNHFRERVLLNRISGTEHVGLVALANQVQPFSFYGDYLRLMDRDFVNPISPGSTERYFFNIEDTLVLGADTLWSISFRPRKGKVFDGLKGVLQVNSHGWAVQTVRAEPATPMRNFHLKIEQGYRRVDYLQDGQMRYQWFPEQLDFEIYMPNFPTPYVQLGATGRSYISQVTINPEVALRDFDAEMPLLIEENAFSKSDSSWATWRGPQVLSSKEKRTYHTLDSLGKKANIDPVMATTDYWVTGRIPLSKHVNLRLNQLLRFNNYELFRIGIGLTNAIAKPLRRQKTLEWNAYWGYGWRDKSTKYGADLLWRVDRGTETQVRLGARSDIMEPGALYELLPLGTADRTLYARYMDRHREATIGATTRLGRVVHVQATLRRQDVQPARYVYHYRDDSDQWKNRFQFAEGTLVLRLAAGDVGKNLMDAGTRNTMRWPIVELAFTQGWKGLLGGEYQYQRWAASATQAVYLSWLGRARWRIEVGQVTPTVPLSKLFTLNQVGNSTLNAFVVNYTFQTLPDTLLAAHRYANLFWVQEIGPVLYRAKRSAPVLSLLHNAAWGQLDRPERQDFAKLGWLSRPHMETGFRLDNVLLVNYGNLASLGVGGAVFYRWGIFHDPIWWRNLSPRLALRFHYG